MPEIPTYRSRTVQPMIITGLLIAASFAFVAYLADRNDPVRNYVGQEFKIEGFEKAKVVAISNGRAMTVLTNLQGQNSFHEFSLGTVDMFLKADSTHD